MANAAASPKIYLQIPALVLVIIGFLMIWSSLGTPAWQVVYARELQQWVQSGLWIACQTRPAGMYTCTYTFTRSDFDFYTQSDIVSYRTPSFYQWQRNLLHIFLVSQLIVLFALISFCISHSSSVEKPASLAFNIFVAIATIMNMGCLLAFLVFSHMVEYRFYTVSVSGIYEKHLGYSFYLATFGTIFILAALIVSGVYTFKLMRQDRWAGGSEETISGYRDQMYPLGIPQFSSEDQFAMRALPKLPYQQR